MATDPPLLSRDEYYDRLRSGGFSECDFCVGESKQIVLNTGTHWLWVASIAPYWRYHTMFVPRRHVADIEELTQEELDELITMKKLALARYAEANITWTDGTPINTFTYMWRVRDGGADLNFKVTKTVHLHVHMWPEVDGFQAFQVDPQAVNWDPNILRSKQ